MNFKPAQRMSKAFRSLIFLLLISVLFTACVEEKKPFTLAVSYLSGNPEESNYIQWLKQVEPDLNYVVMNSLPLDSVAHIFDDCSGLLLTGGEDVFPGRYGQAEDTVKCGTINYYRDSLEFLLIDRAMHRQTPILGVCRGQQILNVALGGSLIVDIPSEVHSLVPHRCDDWQNCFHQVKVLDNNLLSQISGVGAGLVTTNHHQAVKRLGEPFRVLAVANDGIIESIGWKEPQDKPWLLAVQWHPERMDSTNQLSRPLAERLLEEAHLYHQNN